MKNTSPTHKGNDQDRLPPGISLEKIVCRIQQMMDLDSTVTQNEFLKDRTGNRRQYDVVIRGSFGGRPVLGVIECKDHSRRTGPSAIEAFSKKADNLGANLRIMVTKKGFTPQALTLAKYEHVGCFSLLPNDPEQVGFSIGDVWYGVIWQWTDLRLTIHFDLEAAPISAFSSETVMWKGKPVLNWFIRELLTKHGEEESSGEHTFKLKFDETQEIEIADQAYPVLGITCSAIRVCQKKRKWVHWSGDALYDWHNSTLTIPAKGTVVGSAVETDLRAWDDYDGEIPATGENPIQSLMRVVLFNTQKWDDLKDADVPDLMSL